MIMAGAKVTDSYTDRYGRTYNVKTTELPVELPAGQCYRFGKFIAKTSDTEFPEAFSAEESGMAVYQDRDNPDVGYRIYRGMPLALKPFYYPDGCGDAQFIEELQKRQSTVNLTEFPYGIITLNNWVIGSEMVFHHQYETLKQFAIKIKDDPMKVEILGETVLSLLDAFKELMDNEIFYGDLHTSNVMVKKGNPKETKIIDFEDKYIKFGKFTKANIESYQKDFPNFMNVVNEYAEVPYEMQNLRSDNPIEEFREEVFKMQRTFR